MTLERFLAEHATDEERRIVSESWNSYIRNALVVGKNNSRVWPMNVDYSLRATLTWLLVPRQATTQLHVFSDYTPDLETMTIDDFLKYYDSQTRYIDDFITDGFSRFANKDKRSQNDPIAFPPSSVVYRDFRVLESAIGVINNVISNLEQAYRKLRFQIVKLENDVRTQNEVYYLTEAFQRKFELYK